MAHLTIRWQRGSQLPGSFNRQFAVGIVRKSLEISVGNIESFLALVAFEIDAVRQQVGLWIVRHEGNGLSTLTFCSCRIVQGEKHYREKIPFGSGQCVQFLQLIQSLRCFSKL